MASAWLPPSIPFSQLYPAAILCICSLLVISLFLSPRRRRLAPVNWPVVGMSPAVALHFHHIHDFITDALREVGYTLVFKGPWLLGPNFLITCDPANVQHIFNTNYANYPKGADFTEILGDVGGGLLAADGESWRLQRRLAHAFLADPALRASMEAFTKEKVDMGLVPLLAQSAASGEVVDLDDLFARFAFDVTSLMVSGYDPASLSAGAPKVAFAAAMDDLWEAMVFRQAVAKSWWKLLRRLQLGPERKIATFKKVTDVWSEEVLARKREERNIAASAGGGERAIDLLSCYMDQPLEEVVRYFESEEKFLKDTVISSMIAGRDATSVGLSWFFWVLSQNPGAEYKILQELKDHAPKIGCPEAFDADELSGLVYLHGALCESLRLYAPIPFEQKCAARDDVLPSGHRVAAGTKILFSLYSMGRMEEIWGKDCMEFRPERWFGEGGKTRHVPAYKFLVFNSGARSCLGKDIALMQMKMVAATVIWNFKVEVVRGQKVKAKNSVMLRMKNGLRVRVQKRDVSSL